MTIQMFPLDRPKQRPATPARRPVPITHQLVLLSVVLNVCTLVVVAHLSHTLLSLVQR
jgi:hypothetical protein